MFLSSLAKSENQTPVVCVSTGQPVSRGSETCVSGHVISEGYRPRTLGLEPSLRTKNAQIVKTIQKEREARLTSVAFVSVL